MRQSSCIKKCSAGVGYDGFGELSQALVQAGSGHVKKEREGLTTQVEVCSILKLVQVKKNGMGSTHRGKMRIGSSTGQKGKK